MLWLVFENQNSEKWGWQNKILHKLYSANKFSISLSG